MQEKDMVLDILSGTKASIGSYAKVITETSDQNLRKTFQQMRDGDEKFQYDLYNIAREKGYYITSPTVSQEDANKVKSALTQAMPAAHAPGSVSPAMG
ncbi:MAG: spore coat protein [Firmicutes bacterium]|nr:spore coat protein [Bacillota bacterium]